MYNFSWMLAFFLILLPDLSLAHDGTQAKEIEIKEYQKRIYAQKDLIKNLDDEVSTLKNQLQAEKLLRQDLIVKINNEKKQTKNLYLQITQLSQAQKTLETNNQIQAEQLRLQANQIAISQQNQQQCLREIQSLAQQLQSANAYRSSKNY